MITVHVLYIHCYVLLLLELVINVEVPHKQKFLKSGKAQMRIRNTGFTITSLDAPPKCMGTWLILHVRKFGGGDAFKFETGNFITTVKCIIHHEFPLGVHLYNINVIFRHYKILF